MTTTKRKEPASRTESRRREYQLAGKVGKKVLALRRRTGMSQVEASRRAQISPQCLAQIESGKRCPTLPVIFRLTKVLKTTVDSVLPKKIP